MLVSTGLIKCRAGRTFLTHAIHNNPSTGILFTLLHSYLKNWFANYASIATLKMIVQKIQ